MKTILSSVLWLQVGVAVGLVNGQAPRPALSLSVEWVKNSSPDDHRVVVRAEIRNNSNQPVEVSTGSPIADYDFTVVGPDLKPVSLTKRGEQAANIPGVDSKILYPLAPQQTISKTLTLSDFWDFSKPGTYRVVIRRRAHGRGGEPEDSRLLVSDVVLINVP